MNKEIEIPEGYKARIEGNKVILEPKESDDERIRKEIIAYAKNLKDIAQSGRTEMAVRKDDIAMCNRWLSYLEKQKEQVPAEISNIDLGTKVNAWVGYMLNDNAQSYSRKDVQIMLDNCARYFYDYAVMCLDKPAEWSEEDEKNLQGVIDEIEANKNTAPGYDIPTYDKFLTWLKSLRPQPKVELTELDKNILKAAIAFVEQNDHFNCWGGVDKHTVLSALRSLKPHWKPSEEQMEAVEEALEFYSGTTDTAKGLRSLYNDLKKLQL